MIGDVAVGLVGTAGILLLGPFVDSLLLRREPGRWLAPEAWIVLLVVWHVGVAAAISSGYDPAADIDVGAEPGVLRETATISGTPLIALAGLALLLRWRVVWPRRHLHVVWAMAALALVGVLSVAIGFLAGNDGHYIASDTWRWAVLPLWGVLVLAEERPRPAVIVLVAPAVTAFTMLLDAYGNLDSIGDGVELGPLSTLTFAATTVFTAWVARFHPRALPAAAVVLALELVVSFSSPQRTPAVLAVAAVAIALLFAWRLGSLRRAAIAIFAPVGVLAVAIVVFGSVRDYAQPAIDRWEQRAEEEVAPTGEPELVPAPVPEPEPEPEPEPDMTPQPDLTPEPDRTPEPDLTPPSEVPNSSGAGYGSPYEAETILATASIPAQAAAPAPVPAPAQPAEQPKVLSFSTVGERREEVRESRDWLLRGSFPLDVVRVVFGVGQGAQYAAPRLPALDTRSKPGFRHHIHLTYMGIVLRSGLVGLAAFLAALGLLFVVAIRAIRTMAPASWDGVAARVVLAALVLFSLEMVTGFVFVGTMEGGVVAAAALALAVRTANTIEAR